jgi:hypothetical protein
MRRLIAISIPRSLSTPMMHAHRGRQRQQQQQQQRGRGRGRGRARGRTARPQQNNTTTASDYDQLKTLVERAKTYRPEYHPTRATSLLTPATPLLHRALPSPAAVSCLELLLWALDQCGEYDKLRATAKSIVALGAHRMPSVLWNRACYLAAATQCDNTELGQTARWLAGALEAINNTNLVHDIYTLPHAEIHRRIMLVMKHFPLGDTFTLHRLIMRLSNEELCTLASQQALYNMGSDQPVPCLLPHQIRGRPKIVFTGEDFNARPTGLLIRRFIDHPPPDMELHVIQIGNPTPIANQYSFRAAHIHYHETGNAEQARAILDQHRFDAIVDTKGLMFKNHCCLLSPRRAPLQIHWLAFPGTLGVPNLDYTIGDPIVTPPGNARHLLENVIRMPECYQINDDSFKIEPQSAPPKIHRRPGRLLLACVNMNYKICHETVLAWQRILRQCPDVDLAVVCRSKAAIAAVSLAFRSAQFRADRIQAHMGQPRMPFLTNIRQEVDLVVDPFRCPGHTTASDAFTAGIPVVSLVTDTFHGSVGHSLATAMGLADELTARTPHEYIEKTVALLRDTPRREALRARVRQQRRWSTLYDSRRYMDLFWSGIRAALKNTKAGAERSDIDIVSTSRFGPEVALDQTVAAFTAHIHPGQAVSRFILNDVQVMVSMVHGEVWAGERCLTTEFQPTAQPPAQPPSPDGNVQVRFSRSAKGTCVVQGLRPVLLGIPFPRRLQSESGTLCTTEIV